MTKRQITLEVDSNLCFDNLAKLDGDTNGIGSRLAGALLTGHASMADQIGLLAVYGVEIKEIKDV